MTQTTSAIILKKYHFFYRNIERKKRKRGFFFVCVCLPDKKPHGSLKEQETEINQEQEN